VASSGCPVRKWHRVCRTEQTYRTSGVNLSAEVSASSGRVAPPSTNGKETGHEEDP
jgi:hypothetical protein